MNQQRTGGKEILPPAPIPISYLGILRWRMHGELVVLWKEQPGNRNSHWISGFHICKLKAQSCKYISIFHVFGRLRAVATSALKPKFPETFGTCSYDTHAWSTLRITHRSRTSGMFRVYSVSLVPGVPPLRCLWRYSDHHGFVVLASNVSYAFLCRARTKVVLVKVVSWKIVYFPE